MKQLLYILFLFLISCGDTGTVADSSEDMAREIKLLRESLEKISALAEKMTEDYDSLKEGLIEGEEERTEDEEIEADEELNPDLIDDILEESGETK